MATQTIIVTAVPSSISLDPATLPVSLVVSPRLRGAALLGAFPDWEDWTAQRQARGLQVVFECQGNTLAVDVAVGGLRPDLWRALFTAQTLVNSHEFDDYAGRFVPSYSVRAALGLLKSTYQSAGVAFALPEGDNARASSALRRRLFAAMVGGYKMHWDDDLGMAWRDELWRRQRDLAPSFGARQARTNEAIRGLVDEYGLYRTEALGTDPARLAAAQEDLVKRFAVFAHMPTGASLRDQAINFGKVLDFHQALSALNDYRPLQRLLGLAFDVELPPDFVAQAARDAPGELRVARVDGHFDAGVETAIPVTSTAYIHTTLGERRLFAVASRQFRDRSRALEMFGLLNLDPAMYGLAQVDVDGALHKTVMLADMVTRGPAPSPARHPEVFDPAITLPSLRSGGISLFADERALTLCEAFQRSRTLNDALEANGTVPTFFAEDLLRGVRLDVWDDHTQAWHSLHRKNTTYRVGEPGVEVRVADEEGFVQLAATQAPPKADGTRARDDLYLHEAMARWNGWSLSADMAGKHLTRSADPDRALPDAANPDPENEPVTPFKVVTTNEVVAGSLPRLRFGAGYRFRARLVDLAGNGLAPADAATAMLTPQSSLPQGEAIAPYLRFEPIAAPTLVLRDAAGAAGRGSAVDRLVIRTFNTEPARDGAAADLAAAERHIAPPRASVELGERHGMFDAAGGKLDGSAAMWDLVRGRDAGEFPQITFTAPDGNGQRVPLVADAQAALPYLPDPLARGAALRDLPGSPAASRASAEPGAGAEQAVHYEALAAANPRPGSVTMIGFGGRDDWQEAAPFRLALADGSAAPRWDPQHRLLTAFLPKAGTCIVALSCWCDPEDLKLMGVWQWLREYIEFDSLNDPSDSYFRKWATKDRIGHILQLAQEGGHGMLTPPRLLTLVHAVQQPLGRPAFTRLAAQYGTAARVAATAAGSKGRWQTQPETGPTAGAELDVLTAWREPRNTDVLLGGALQVNGASTAKVDIVARWTDPVDDVLAPAPAEQSFSAHVDDILLQSLAEGPLSGQGGTRQLGYYDADHDLICFGPAGTRLGNLTPGATLAADAAPCHRIGDTRHHVVTYKAVATSRFREYFEQAEGGEAVDFTRGSDEVTLRVPASAPPVGPQVMYVVPTFGWQRDTATNQKRSMRTAGGLRVYLERPWHSSGEGELLGVVLAAARGLDREQWKPYISQWGQDPIWESAPLEAFPALPHFPDAIVVESNVALTGTPTARRADIAGHAVHFDDARRLWYCDLAVDTRSASYTPFVRLALARYQPHALVEAKLSPVVLADFVQLTPERTATVTADPYRRGRLRVAVSGPVPRGPMPAGRPRGPRNRPNLTLVSVQQRDRTLASDLAWTASAAFSVESDPPAQFPGRIPGPDFMLWSGTVTWTGAAKGADADRYRILIQEYELLSADGEPAPIIGHRLIYAETIVLDAALLAGPPPASHTNPD